MYRDITMKEISEQHIGQTLQVAGWVENIPLNRKNALSSLALNVRSRITLLRHCNAPAFSA
mgnify:CR=1 FL=1